jgi:hypothetical protein
MSDENINRSKVNLNVDDDEDDEVDDGDYCPTTNDHESSDDSQHTDDEKKDVDIDNVHQEQIQSNIKPYDESKTDALWQSFTKNVTSTSTNVKNDNVSTSSVAMSKPTTMTSNVLEYAGEKVTVSSTVTNNTSLKRAAPPMVTSSSILDRLGIGKKQKLSTLEKSRLDWQSHKESESLTDDLESHRRSKNSYVEKTAFLQRSETRAHDHYLNNLKKK